MKIWRSFGSGHSAHLTVIGTFKTIDDAQIAEEVVDDFVHELMAARTRRIHAVLF